MKLNVECVRDILLEVEEQTSYKVDFVLDPSKVPPGRLAPYLYSEVAGHISQCNSRGMFAGYSEDILGCIYVDDLSEKGAEYLETIRDDSHWAAVKKKVSDITASPQMNVLVSAITTFASSLFNGG